MKKVTFTYLMTILVVLMVQIFTSPSIQAQINLYGTAGSDQHFTHVIPDGPDYYLLGQEGFQATISRVLGTGAWVWTQKLNISSGLLDAVVMPNGHLLFVGLTLQFPNQSIIGEIDRNKNLICLNIFDSPGTEGIARIDAINATTYLAVGFQTSNTPQDIVVYKISTAAPGCAILQKYQFINLPGADYGHDIVVTGPNSFMICGNDANNTAVIYHYDLISGQLGGVIEPVQYEYVDIEPVAGDLLAAANSLNGGRPYIVRFDSDLLPIWEQEIFGLTSVNQILVDGNDKIYVVGTANNINRTVVLKLDDCSGACSPVPDWPGGVARYLDDGSTAYSGGHLAVINGGLAFADGREGPGGIGMEDGFLSLTDDDMSSLACWRDHQVELIEVSTFFASPVGDLLFQYEFPIQDSVGTNMQMWEYKEVCESILLDSCICSIPEFSLFYDGVDYPLLCLPHGGQTPVLGCPNGLALTGGFFGCIDPNTGEPCPIETLVVWLLSGPNGPVDGGTATNYTQFLFPPSYFQTNGTYTLSLSTLCPGKQDSCVCVLDWIVECDSCCTDQLAFLDAAADVETFGTLGNCNISFQANGMTDCMQITYDWGDGQFTSPITGNNVPVSHTYAGTNTYYVCYTIEEISNNEVCWEYTHCDSTLIICDPCCTDYDLFCQNVMNAINISVNNSSCKATVDINGLPECHSIENINWGDGNIDLGPFENGDSPMHTYSSGDNYTISISAVSYDFSTFPESLCFMKTFIDSVEINCDTVLDQECCAYEIKLINQNQQSNVKKVRLSALCETKICCAESDAWSQDLVGSDYVEWYLSDGSNIPYGTTINNDFIVYLDKSSSTHEMMVEWFDASNNVVCRHFITMACNGMYTEDENWLQYTSTTQLNDPTLLVFAVREPDADEEITDCDPASRGSCPLQYTVYCNGGNSYLVYLQALSGLIDYKWEGFENGIPFVINNNTSETANFLTSQGGSYHIGFTSKYGRTEECNGSIDIILPEMIPDFIWELQPCGTDVLLTPTGWSDLNAVSTITWYSLDGLPGFPIVSNSPVIRNFPTPLNPNIPEPWNIVMVIQDVFGCSYQVTHTVVIDLRCKPSFKIDYLLCKSGCNNGNQPVQVKFTNTSTGGDCASGINYSWNFGDGSTPMIENAMNFNKPNDYIVTCPTGTSFPVTLTMTSTVNGSPCTEQITQPINIAPCDVSISITTICPDGKYVFSANVPGLWSFPGSVDIAPWPHSDKPDIYGRQKFVAVRYNSGFHLVSFTGFCPNGGYCTIRKEIFVDKECYAVNDKVTHEYYEPSNGSWVIKSKFIQRQFAFIHRITAKTIFKRQKSIGGYTYYRRAKASEIESSFTGQIFTSDCSVGCNYSDPNNIYASNPESNKKKSRALDARIGKFKSWINSLTSTHRVKINANDPNSIYINLFLGHDCDNPKWNCPPD
jgi:hypothetical protein